MALHRAFTDFALSDLKVGDSHPLSKDLAHRFFRVLRLKSHDQCALIDGLGMLVLGRLDAASHTFTVESIERAERQRPQICIAQAMSSMEKMEEVVRHGTEIGVDAFILYTSTFGKHGSEGLSPTKLQRLERILEDATRQSERLMAPVLSGPLSFDALIQSGFGKNALVLFGHPAGKDRLWDVLEQNLDGTKDRITMVVGPEGGLSPHEIACLKQAGAKASTFGPYVLRTETAALVAASIIQCFLRRA